MDSPSTLPNSALRFAPVLSLLFTTFVVLVTVVHVLAYLVSPFGIVQQGNRAFAYILVYFLIMLGISAVGSIVLGRLTGGTIEQARSAIGNLTRSRRLLPALFTTTAIGNALHIYTKFSVIDFDSIDSLGNLRFFWLRGVGLDHGVWYSLASGSGHILSTFAAVGLFVTFLKTDRLPCKAWWAWIVGFTITTFLYAVPIGSRSVLLSFLMMASLGAVLHGLMNQWRWLFTPRTGLGLAFIGALFLAYSGYAFAERIVQRDVVSQDGAGQAYLDGYKDELFTTDKSTQSATTTDSPLGPNILDSPFANAQLMGLHAWLRAGCASCAMVAIYLSHGIWNFQHALPYDERPQWAFVSFARHWLSRAGIEIGPNDDRRRVYGSGSIALAGAAWYDFGVTGLVVIAALHALFILAAGLLLPRGGVWSSLGVVIYACIGLVTLWSLLAFAVNTLSFPFIALAFLVTFGAVLIGPLPVTKRGARELDRHSEPAAS